MASDSIKVRFTLTPSDLRGFQMAILGRRFPLLLLWIAAAIVTVFLFNLYGDWLFYWLGDVGFSDEAAEAITRFSPLLFVIPVVAAVFIVKRRREGKRPRPRPVYLEQQITISAEGMSIVRDGLSGHVEWRAFQDIRYRPNATYLYLDDRQAYLIPCRAFATREAFAQFNQAVKGYFDAAHPEAV